MKYTYHQTDDSKLLMNFDYYSYKYIKRVEYQKIINLLESTNKQQAKFRTKNWVVVNNESGGTYNLGAEIKFKTTVLRSSLCDYSDAYKLKKGTIAITGAGADAVSERADEINKHVTIKTFSIIYFGINYFTDCISEIINTKVDNGKYPDFVLLMYNLIEYSDSYAKT